MTPHALPPAVVSRVDRTHPGDSGRDAEEGGTVRRRQLLRAGALGAGGLGLGLEAVETAAGQDAGVGLSDDYRRDEPFRICPPEISFSDRILPFLEQCNRYKRGQRRIDPAEWSAWRGRYSRASPCPPEIEPEMLVAVNEPELDPDALYAFVSRGRLCGTSSFAIGTFRPVR